MTQQAVLADGLMPAAGNGAVPAGARPAGRRVVLVQTKAEAAGAQEITRILGRGLTARGYDVYSIFLFRRTAAFDREPNTAFCAAQRPTGPVTLLKMFVALVRHLKELQPDVVLCFQHYGILVGTLAAHMAGTPIVIANRTSSKSLVPRWARAADLAFGLIGLFRRVVVNCRAIEQEYAAFPRRYRNRVMRIDHGFEAKAAALGRNDARKLLKLPADATLVGSVGRLHPGKNLAAAIRILPGRDWHLALAGQGEARRDLAALAAALGVSDRVHFLGELPPARIGAFLRALDVFVFPSLAETFGLAAVEAAQAGVPVVANDIDVLRETLAVGGRPCALFVNANDTGAFATAVQRLVEDRQLAAVLASRGTQLSQRYSLGAMVERYAGLIEAVSRRSWRPVKA
ncbi:MAG TPA: glycosyltransferase family 4 protein [Xanthobacteraceae bacterium]|nr:glycosyltransferase family 4 protein [Xanthobacteraceae bacterium]